VHRYLLSVLLLAGMLVTHEVQADQKAVKLTALPYVVHEAQLAHGLRVICVPWPGQSAVAYYTLVSVGSRNEVQAGYTGFAHLFEHMMFRGTKDYPGALFESKLQALGADSNAYTTQDFTLYMTTVAAPMLGSIIALEANRIKALSYSEQMFQTEAGAVLGEYHKSTSDPAEVMWERLSELAFHVHPYRHTTMGTLADIQQMPNHYRYSWDFFRRHYVPGNIVIIVVGDIDPKRVVAQVREQYHGLASTPPARMAIPVDPEPTAESQAHIAWKGPSERRILIGYRGMGLRLAPSATRFTERLMAEYAALQVVHELAFGATSPLSQRWVVNERVLTEFRSWQGYVTRDPGLFVIEATFSQSGVPFETVVKGVQSELDKLKGSKISPRRIQAARSHLLQDLLIGIDSPGDLAELLAKFEGSAGSYGGLNAYLSMLRRVTAKDVAQVVSKYLRPHRRIAVTLTGTQS
jgi:zinc protease